MSIQDYKMTYEKFISEFRVPEKWKTSKLFKECFNILNRDDALIGAIIQIKYCHKPPLVASVEAIDRRIKSSDEIDPSDILTFNTFKQSIGVMQKAVLVPFGYFPVNGKQKKLKESKYFSSATCFYEDFTVNAPLKVRFDIEVR